MEIEVKKYWHICMTSACCAGVSLGRSNVISSGSSIQPAMFDLELEWTVRVGGGRRARSNLNSPTPLLIFDRRPSPAFRCHKIKDGGHNFCIENTKHSPAKITPDLQASMTFDWLVVIHSYAAISFPLLNKGKERRHLTITQRWQV